MALWDVLPLAVSDLTIAGISAGAALLGGVLGVLVGGLVTYRIEQSRQEHERKLAAERHEHERKVEQERYEQQQSTREQQDLDVARGLARVMLNDFILARRRLHNPLSVAILALSLVIVLTVLWEVAEYVGDRLLDTALVPRKRDSAEDVFFGTLGGSVGVAFASVVLQWRRAGPH